MQKAASWRRIAVLALLIPTAFSVSIASQAAVTGTVQGTVRSESGAPLKGANVTLEADNTPSQSTVTDKSGYYVFTGVLSGHFVVHVALVTFEGVSAPVTVQQDNTSTVDFALKKQTISTGTSRIIGTPVRRGETQTQYTISARTEQLTKSQVNTLYQYAGIVFGQPGVTTSASGDTHIRGSDENQLGFMYDGVPIVEPTQNGFVTNLMTNGLKSANLYTGGADASYDGSTGGYINLVTPNGRDLRGGEVEGTASVGHGYDYVGTQSQVGEILPDGKLDYYASTIQFRNNFPGNTQISSLPVSNDQLVKLNYYANPQNTFTGFLSSGFEDYNIYYTPDITDPNQNGGYDLKYENKLSNAVHNGTFQAPHDTQPYSFHYFTWKHNFDSKSFLSYRFAYLHNHYDFHAESDMGTYFGLSTTQRSNQLDYTNQLSRAYQLRAGLSYIPADALYHRITGITGTVQEMPPSGYTDVTSDFKLGQTAMYLQNTLKPLGDKLTIDLGLRHASQTFTPKAKFSAFTDSYTDPRLGVAYSPARDLVFRSSYSIQSQFPDTRRLMYLGPADLGIPATATNPEAQIGTVQSIFGQQFYPLKAEHAVDIDFGVEKALTVPGVAGGAYDVSATIFRHRQYDLIQSSLESFNLADQNDPSYGSPYPLTFNNGGHGLATGLEFQLTKRLRRPSDWNGFISYTNQVAKATSAFSVATPIVGYLPIFFAFDYGNPLMNDADYRALNDREYSLPYDQRHTVAIVADKRFSNFLESAFVLDAGSGYPFAGGGWSDGVLGTGADAQHTEKRFGDADWSEVPVTLTANGSTIQPYSPVVGRTGWHYKISVNTNFYLTPETNLFVNVDNVFDKLTPTNYATSDLAGNVFYSPPTPQYPQGRNYFGVQTTITPIFVTVGFRHRF